jgi:hypothetical protein
MAGMMYDLLSRQRIEGNSLVVYWKDACTPFGLDMWDTTQYAMTHAKLIVLLISEKVCFCASYESLRMFIILAKMCAGLA